MQGLFPGAEVVGSQGLESLVVVIVVLDDLARALRLSDYVIVVKLFASYQFRLVLQFIMKVDIDGVFLGVFLLLGLLIFALFLGDVAIEELDDLVLSLFEFLLPDYRLLRFLAELLAGRQPVLLARSRLVHIF